MEESKLDAIICVLFDSLIWQFERHFRISLFTQLRLWGVLKQNSGIQRALLNRSNFVCSAPLKCACLSPTSDTSVQLLVCCQCGSPVPTDTLFGQPTVVGQLGQLQKFLSLPCYLPSQIKSWQIKSWAEYRRKTPAVMINAVFHLGEQASFFVSDSIRWVPLWIKAFILFLQLHLQSWVFISKGV